MKKLLVLAVAAIGALAVTKQIKSKQAENRLWAEATDTPNS